ncbi:hypothetical protein OOU_Y34scaffold00022g16 [Pyricularia oryzae Y34]|uniref:Uncharacterized protein n=1 Tax=Pyricularia oryzae (strain Y34) TaxID=1143189 RepID=A0AA97PAG8_PYRO3|nr:hypothetical protein OOU_Y34scaffold00022g16 [Pyricularia oryzae Y34]
MKGPSKKKTKNPTQPKLAQPLFPRKGHIHSLGLHHLVVLFVVLSAIDIAFNAAAGPAAVAAGAHVEGRPVTAQALGLGAQAGATKAGILAFLGFLGLANLTSVAATMLIIIMATIFGICVLVTAQVSYALIGDTVNRYRKEDKFSGESMNTFHYSRTLALWITTVVWDAIAGVTFAAMAQNLAAAAGAVYGVFSGLSKMIAYIAWGLYYRNK